MPRCRTLMESCTFLCGSFLSSLFTLPFLLPLSVTFSSGSSFLCSFSSHPPPSILHSSSLLMLQKVSLLLSKPYAVIAFLFQIFINLVPLKMKKSMGVTESALLWCLSLFWLHKHPYCVNLLEQNQIYPHLLLEEYTSTLVFYKQTYS